MDNLFGWKKQDCARFREALEALPMRGVGVPDGFSGRGDTRSSVEGWLAELPEAEAKHAATCAACRAALEERQETRNALMGVMLPQAGPWFTARVMAAIAAKERQDETEDGVWINVRRFAPRVVLFSALLLILGGSWAIHQRTHERRGGNGQGGDVVLNSSVRPTWYDDALVSVIEGQP